MKNKTKNILIVALIIVIGCITLLTSYLLTRKDTTTPTKSKAVEIPQSCEDLSFTISSTLASPSPTPTNTPALPDTPSIDIEKHTNGYDADKPKGPKLTEGDDVKWEYIVTNTGSVTLNSIVVTDDKEGTITCPQTTLVASETMICVLHSTARVYQYENTATVMAKDEENNTVKDADMSHYWGEGKSSSLTSTPVAYVSSSPTPTQILTELPDTGSGLSVFLIMIPAVILLVSAVFLL